MNTKRAGTRRLRRGSARVRPADPTRAPGKRHRGRPDDAAAPTEVAVERPARQPWVPTSGLVGRKRRSARRS